MTIAGVMEINRARRFARMLVLSRKESQRIRLGDSIVLTIVKIAGDKVRVGIQAPDDVLVLRDELETWSTSATTTATAPEKQAEDSGSPQVASSNAA